MYTCLDNYILHLLLDKLQKKTKQNKTQSKTETSNDKTGYISLEKISLM